MRDRTLSARLSRWLIALVVAVVASGLVSVPVAGADPVQAGSPHGIIPHQKSSVTLGQQYFQYPLQYLGGPVLRTNQTFAIFWDPSGGGAFPAGYQDLIVRFLKDVAADSGKSNVYSVLNQYYDTTGPIAYDSTFAGSAVDTAPYPAGCPTSQQFPMCFTGQQLASELDSFLSANNIARPANRAFLVFTPPGVQSCFDSFGSECSSNLFCSYHSDFTGGNGQAIYANLPYEAGVVGCDTGQHPNGNGADSTINDLSHEVKEMIDDPLGADPAWQGGNSFFGNESDDLCLGYFGPVQSNGVGAYNQVINGHDYLLQAEFSNKIAQPQHLGCVTSGSDQAPPTAAFTTTVHGAVVTVDASASSEPDPGDSISSYHWDFGDGIATPGGAVMKHTYPAASDYNIQLIVTDNHGAQGFTGRDATVTAPNPTVPFTANLTEQLVDTGSFPGSYGSISGSGIAKRLGTTTEHSLDAFFGYRRWPRSIGVFADVKLSDNSRKNSLLVSYAERLTDTATPPAGYNFTLAGRWSAYGGTGNLSDNYGYGTISGTCTSSPTSDVANCTTTWTGRIGPP